MDKQLRETYKKLIYANHILHHQGVVDAYGHVSVRNPNDSSQYIMCGYMAPALVASPSDLIHYHVSTSDTVEDLEHKGYSERFIHGEIYRRFPTTHCVIHAHTPSVLPYAISVNTPLLPVYHMAGFLGSSVPLWDAVPVYSTLSTPISERDMLVNNPTLGTSLAKAFDSDQSPSTSERSTGEGVPTSGTTAERQQQWAPRAVVLMRRHGFTTQADSIEKAVYRAIYTKENAAAQTGAMAIGRDSGGRVGPLGLTKELVEGCTVMNERFQDKPWKLWVREVEGRGIYVNRLA